MEFAAASREEGTLSPDSMRFDIASSSEDSGGVEDFAIIDMIFSIEFDLFSDLTTILSEVLSERAFFTFFSFFSFTIL